MLNLSNSDRSQLRMALTSGFRDFSTLRIFVSDNLDLRLNNIAPSQALIPAADALIDYFEQRGNESDLILALHKERPRNPEVRELMLRLQGFFEQQIVLDPSTTEDSSLPFALPDLYNDAQLESFLPQKLSYEADVGKLRRGLQLADAVCKVAFTDSATTGTGVLIAHDLVLTNYHVLSKQVIQERSLLAEKAKTLIFEFGFVSGESETPISPETFAIAATEPVVSCSPPAQLDYALLRVEPKIKSFDIKPVPINYEARTLSDKEGLNVLQHPEGNVMQASLSASGVIKVHAAQGRVWYVNRTQGGSSGSPCFNSDWELVALHHASMSRGFGSVREGILFPSILAEISGFIG
jgi:endonuclease G, mitochondrial